MEAANPELSQATSKGVEIVNTYDLGVILGPIDGVIGDGILPNLLGFSTLIIFFEGKESTQQVGKLLKTGAPLERSKLGSS